MAANRVVSLLLWRQLWPSEKYESFPLKIQVATVSRSGEPPFEAEVTGGYQQGLELPFGGDEVAARGVASPP